MINDNIVNLKNVFSDRNIRYCLDFFNGHNLIDYQPGFYDTGMNNISLRIDEYETQIASERYWQAHKYHIDIYILLYGKERIDVHNTADLSAYHYDKQDDMLMLEETKPSSINNLTNYGDVLICYPHEAHKTGIHVELKQRFKVALFKIALI